MTDESLTSIVKQPPDIDESLLLLLVETIHFLFLFHGILLPRHLLQPFILWTSFFVFTLACLRTTQMHTVAAVSDRFLRMLLFLLLRLILVRRLVCVVQWTSRRVFVAVG